MLIAGIPIDNELLQMEINNSLLVEDVGSIIIILTTDESLLLQQLKSLSIRVLFGIEKFGRTITDSSTDIFNEEHFRCKYNNQNCEILIEWFD